MTKNKLPTNKNLKAFATELRNAKNLSEVLLWQQLKGKQLNGLTFTRQKSVGPYIIDLYCASKKVAIEIDGVTHDFKYEHDKKRETYLKALGVTVIHILDIDVKTNLDGVMTMLKWHPALKN